MKESESSGEDCSLSEDFSYPGALVMDAQEWLPYLEEYDFSEERKIEFLNMLWSIMSAFVDLGWGVDSVPNFLPALKEFSVDSQGDVLEQSENNTQQFNEVSASPERDE